MKAQSKFLMIILACFLLSFGQIQLFAQNDNRNVIGVSKFTSDVSSPFVASIEAKVIQMVTNSKRFVVVDRTNYDKVKEELEFQKSEAFLDSKNTVQQDVAVAAQYLVIGHVIKMNIYTMKNNGAVSGYKASASFTLKVNNVESGVTTEAVSFQTEVSPLAASKEQAVNQALQSVEKDLYDYFVKTFPIEANIVRVTESKKDAATIVLIDVGKKQGIASNDCFTVEYIEMLNGKALPNFIGQLKVINLVGEEFAEAKVVKGGDAILQRFNAADKLNCKLIQK